MNIDELSNEEIDCKNDIFNYKGYFIENEEEEEEPKYYEHGAHFQYQELCKILEILRKNQMKKETVKEQKTKINFDLKNQKPKKIENRERNNTKNKKLENNSFNIMQGQLGKSRNKSRNIGVPDVDEKTTQHEMTYIPFNKNNKSNISNLSNQKQDNKSISIHRTNPIKMHDNINRNKRGKYINIKVSQIIKNKSIQNKNKNVNPNLKQNYNQLNPISKKYMLNSKKESKNIYKQINIPIINKGINKNINDVNYFKSYQIPGKRPTNNNNYRNKFFLNDSYLNTNSKENLENSKKNDLASHFTEPKMFGKNLNQHLSTNKTNDKIDKQENNSSSHLILKGGIIKIKNPFKHLLNSYNPNKKNFFSEKKIKKTYSTLKEKQIALKNKNKNQFLANSGTKKKTPASTHNNRKHFSHNEIFDKFNKNVNNNTSNLFNTKNKMKPQTYIKQNSSNKRGVKDFLNNNNTDNKNNNLKNNNIKLNYELKNSNSNITNINNLFDKNEKVSRNKNNNNYFVKNISSINISRYNMINSINNKKANMTQQSNAMFQYRDPKSLLRNKIFNFNNNNNNNLLNNNSKKISIEIPSLSGKKFSTSSNIENSILTKNTYKNKVISLGGLCRGTGYLAGAYGVIKKVKNEKLMNRKSTKINLTKDNLYYRPKKDHILYKNYTYLNGLKSNSYMINKCDNLFKKKTPNKNISINININNNNKIIYNKIIGNKTPLLKKKILKSQIQNVCSRLNNSNKTFIKNSFMNNNDKKCFSKLLMNNNCNNNNNSKLKRNSDKKKFFNIQI